MLPNRKKQIAKFTGMIVAQNDSDANQDQNFHTETKTKFS